MTVSTKNCQPERHSENLPAKMNDGLELLITSGGGICSQKSAESGVLNVFSSGNANKSSGVRMMILLVRVVVALIAVVADGTLVLVGDVVCEAISAGLGMIVGFPPQLLKTRLQRRTQDVIMMMRIYSFWFD